MTTKYAHIGRAIGQAQLLADSNGAPVAVVRDPLTGWYRLVEEAEEYDDLITADGFEPWAVLDPAEEGGAIMRINTWVENELITIDTEDVWARTFVEWDALVETDVAAQIATAVVRVLEEAHQEAQS